MLDYLQLAAIPYSKGTEKASLRTSIGARLFFFPDRAREKAISLFVFRDIDRRALRGMKETLNGT